MKITNNQLKEWKRLSLRSGKWEQEMPVFLDRNRWRTSLVAQWLRIRLPVFGLRADGGHHGSGNAVR